MLDLVEGAKIIVGAAPTTAVTAGGDWINTENMHTVWAICTRSPSKASINVFEGQVAESYAGASNSTATCRYWASTAVSSIDRLTASTVYTGVASGTTAGIVVVRFDPATADSSDHYFRVAMPTSGWGCAVTYICEPRYGGYRQFIATTSST